jgi:Uma2 family endonuclease
MTAVPLQQDIHYPESDGKPMGETEIHIREIMYLFQALNEHLRGVPDVYVGADLRLYYAEGNVNAVVVPDVFVARGVSRGERRTYKLWEEGRPPSLAVEITSDSTRDEDLVRKKNLYERLGVEEYILHDPLGDYLKPSPQGFHLVEGQYEILPHEPDGAIHSRTTGVTFRSEGNRLRLIDTTSGKPLLSYEEVLEAHRAAEAEVARLQAGLDQLRGHS